jgi:DNA repair protein RecO (recombination protein O)
MEWSDEAIVLEARAHGETSVVARLLTREHGLHAGLVQGGAGTRGRGVLQPGNRVAAKWRARLSEHLGTYTLELVESHAAKVLDEPLRLAALQSACAVIAAAMPEREPHEPAFHGFSAWLASLPGEAWDAGYVAFELGLLAALGFGLELDRCAATGAREGLTHVSPRTGRAVSETAAAPFRDRLLSLPGFLIGAGAADPAAIVDGLALSGHFLARSLFAATHAPLPAARERFIESYRRHAANPATA